MPQKVKAKRIFGSARRQMRQNQKMNSQLILYKVHFICWLNFKTLGCLKNKLCLTWDKVSRSYGEEHRNQWENIVCTQRGYSRIVTSDKIPPPIAIPAILKIWLGKMKSIFRVVPNYLGLGLFSPWECCDIHSNPFEMKPSLIHISFRMKTSFGCTTVEMPHQNASSLALLLWSSLDKALGQIYCQ